MDGTFDAPVEEEDEADLSILAVIELSLVELLARDDRVKFLPAEEREAAQRLSKFLYDYLMPESYVGGCRRRDRLLRVGTMLGAMFGRNQSAS